MALTPKDLIAPSGDIQPALFPNDNDHDLDARIDAYILEAEGKVSGVTDDAVRAWVYYRSFRDVFIRLSNEPLDQLLNDQGSARMSKDQIANFGALADQNLAMWNELTQDITSDPKIGLEPTGSVNNHFAF